MATENGGKRGALTLRRDRWKSRTSPAASRHPLQGRGRWKSRTSPAASRHPLQGRGRWKSRTYPAASRPPLERSDRGKLRTSPAASRPPLERRDRWKSRTSPAASRPPLERGTYVAHPCDKGAFVCGVIRRRRVWVSRKPLPSAESSWAFSDFCRLCLRKGDYGTFLQCV